MTDVAFGSKPGDGAPHGVGGVIELVRGSRVLADVRRLGRPGDLSQCFLASSRRGEEAFATPA
ncbi:hypothetical protein [Amycolatopsis sp. cmx-11-51]|uniref:hypothetical protein n=1 Tax=unclassified Amycolatopsis TaxID=2618356 RepID=UPI0039E609F7